MNFLVRYCIYKHMYAAPYVYHSCFIKICDNMQMKYVICKEILLCGIAYTNIYVVPDFCDLRDITPT